jgi:hypothetical protein
LPPRGEGWQCIGGDENGIAFAKGVPDTHSHAAIVAWRKEGKKDESRETFAERMRLEFTESGRTGRHRNLEVDCVLDDTYGQHCVRFHWSAEDHGVPNMNEGEFMLLDAYGYTFVHPNIENLTAKIEYSERRLPGLEETATGADRDAFLKGLRLKPGRLPMRSGEIGGYFLFAWGWNTMIGDVSGFGESGTFDSRNARDLYSPNWNIKMSVGVFSPTQFLEIELHGPEIKMTSEGQALLDETHESGTELTYSTIGLLYGRFFARGRFWCPFAGLYVGGDVFARRKDGETIEKIEGFNTATRVGVDWKLISGRAGSLFLRTDVRVPLYTSIPSVPYDIAGQIGLAYSRE